MTLDKEHVKGVRAEKSLHFRARGVQDGCGPLAQIDKGEKDRRFCWSCSQGRWSLSLLKAFKERRGPGQSL